MPTDLERSVFRTVAFFSLFDYPLTAFEIWKWLLEPPAGEWSFASVVNVLEESQWLQEHLEHKDGFFVRQGQRPMIALRQQRFVDAVRKYRRLRWVCRYLARLPMIKCVAVCNSLAWNNTKPESDIDLFIITKPGRIWFTRLLTVLPFALLGWRPKVSARDPVCFSFFLSEDHLSLQDIRLHDRDIYLGQWIRSLVPVLDRGIFQKFIEQNSWVEQLFPNSFAVRPAPSRLVRSEHRHADFGHWFEPCARFFQEKRLPKEIKVLANRDTRVVVNNQMLKFHPNDRRAEFLEKLAILEGSL